MPKTNPQNKKLTAFRIDDEIRKAADKCIIIRALKQETRAETFSHFLRNLIVEEYDRNKDFLKNMDDD